MKLIRTRKELERTKSKNKIYEENTPKKVTGTMISFALMENTNFF